MHRVELKAFHPFSYGRKGDRGFLMHRVELKENKRDLFSFPALFPVPNAPCGVESGAAFAFKKIVDKFLMHRVELKDA